MHSTIAATRVSFFERFFLFVLASGLFACAGLLKAYLPFTPVPIVFQVNLAILFGALFGSRSGSRLMLSIIGMAGLGLPMFSGMGGWVYLLGPTGGYIAGYVAAAFVMGKLVETNKIESPLQVYKYLLFANLFVYALGLPYLALFVGSSHVLQAGLLPFIPGMLVKNIFIAKLYFALKESTSSGV